MYKTKYLKLNKYMYIIIHVIFLITYVYIYMNKHINLNHEDTIKFGSKFYVSLMLNHYESL